MKYALFLICFALAIPITAQKLVGFVKEQSSNDRYLGGVKIFAPPANETYTDDNGYFTLDFSSKKPGDVVNIRIVQLAGYEVINKPKLEHYTLQSVPDQPALVIVMARVGEYEQKKAEFYQTIYGEGQRALRQELNRLEEELALERKNSRAKDEKLIAITDSIAAITVKLDNLDPVAEAASDYFAQIDLDQATELERKALAELKKGNIEGALAAMPEAELDQNMATALARRDQLAEQTAKNEKIIEQSIKNYLTKARLYVVKGDYVDAERLYEKAIAADTTNVELMYDYAVFLEEINQYDKAISWFEQVIPRIDEEWRRANAFAYLGDIYRETGNLAKAGPAYRRAFERGRRLVVAEPENIFYQSNSAIFHERLGTIYQAQGQFDSALVYFQLETDLFEELYRDNPKSENLKNGLAISYSKLGDIYQAQGQFDSALVYFQLETDLFEELYRDNPKSENLKNGLAISYSKLGDIYQAQGQFDSALVYFQQRSTLGEELYRDNPKSENLKNGLAISYEKLGAIYQAQGQFDSALVYFQLETDLFEELYRDNPKSENLKNGLAISYSKLGDIYQAQGQFDSALVYFQQRSTLGEELYRDNPKSENLKNGLAISYEKLGAIYQAQGQFDSALVYFQLETDLFEELYRDNPKSENLKNGLAISYSKLGDIYQAQGQFDSALVYFQLETDLFEELYRDNPKSENLKNGLAISYEKLGAIYQAQGQFDSALVYFQLETDLFEELYRDNPKSENLKNGLAISYEKLGAIYQAQGQFDSALVYFQQRSTLGEELYRDNPKNYKLEAGVGISYFKLGQLWSKLDSTDIAIKFFEQAQSVFESVFVKTQLTQYQSWRRSIEQEIEKLRNPPNPIFERIAELQQSVTEVNTYPEKVRYQQELVELLQRLLDEVTDPPEELVVYTANHYGGLAWYLLFTEDFAAAEQVARTAIKMHADAEWIHTNLALALLYQGNWDDAAKIYRQYRDQPFPNDTDGRSWREVFLQDLTDMEAEGIMHPLVKQVRDLLGQ